MAYISVDIDLDDVDNRDLLDQIECRYWNEYETARLLQTIKTDQGQKMIFFMQVMDKYSFLELEELFKEKIIHQPAPKEQLSLL